MFFFFVGLLSLMFGICGLDSSEPEGWIVVCLAGVILLMVGSAQMSDKGDKK